MPDACHGRNGEAEVAGSDNRPHGDTGRRGSKRMGLGRQGSEGDGDDRQPPHHRAHGERRHMARRAAGDELWRALHHDRDHREGEPDRERHPRGRGMGSERPVQHGVPPLQRRQRRGGCALCPQQRHQSVHGGTHDGKDSPSRRRGQLDGIDTSLLANSPSGSTAPWASSTPRGEAPTSRPG